MAETWVFLASNSLAGISEAATAAGGVYDDYDRVIAAVREQAGGDVAALFARPVVTRGNGTSITSVTWYSSRRGNIQPWADLDYDTQGRIAAELGGMFERLRPLASDQQVGESVQRWLNLPRLDGNLFLIGNSPVIINWGQLPAGAVDRPQERQDLFAAGLQRFAPWSPVPPFLAGDTASFAAPRPAPVSPAAVSTPTNSASPQDAVRPVMRPPVAAAALPPDDESRRVPWIGLAIATAIAAIILLILLIPGVLRYHPRDVSVTDQSIDQSAGILRQRIADLQTALQAPICDIGAVAGSPAEFLVPGVSGGEAIRYQPDNTLPPIGNQTAPTSVAPTPAAVEPPVASGPSAPATSATNLVEFLDEASVLVVVEGQRQIATGSGFFVNPTDIVTNLHVIEGMAGSPIYVVNAAFDRPQRASVVATTQSAEAGRADMAILRIAAPAPGPFLKLASDVPRGSNVLAFGFPSFVLDSDTQFQCLMSGGMQAANSNCIPYGSVTTGVVTALQQGEEGLPLVLHSATISEGNSGGPLVDYCGRAVGMNTFGRRDVERVQQLNFAQQATAIASFLTSNSIRHEVEETGCALVPAAMPTAAPVAAEEVTPVDPAAPDAAEQS